MATTYKISSDTAQSYGIFTLGGDPTMDVTPTGTSFNHVDFSQTGSVSGAFFGFITQPNVPNTTSWGAGDWSVSVQLGNFFSAGGSAMTITGVQLCRVSADGGTLLQVLAQNTSLSTVFSGSNPSGPVNVSFTGLSAFTANASDRIAVRLIYNTTGTCSWSITGAGASATSSVATPFDPVAYVGQTFTRSLSDTLSTSASTTAVRGKGLAESLHTSDVLGFKHTGVSGAAIKQKKSMTWDGQSTNATVSLDTAPTAGNIVLAFLYQAYGQPDSTYLPAAFTYLLADGESSSPSAGSVAGYLVVQSGDTGSYTFPNTGLSRPLAFELYELSNVTATGIAASKNNSGSLSATGSVNDIAVGCFGIINSTAQTISGGFTVDDNPNYSTSRGDYCNAVFFHQGFTGSQTLTATDSVGSAGGLMVYVAHGTGSSSAQWGQSFSETLPVLDAVLASSTKTLSSAPADTLTTSESMTRLLLAQRTASDSCVSADTLASMQQLAHVLSDTSALSAAVATLKGFVSGITDTSSFADAAALQHARTASETLSTSDSLVSGFAVERALSDITSVIDDITRVTSYGRSASDTSSFTDALIGLQETLAALTESTSTADAMASLFAVSRALLDALDTHDALLTRGTYSRTASQSFSTLSSVVYALLTDLPIITMALSLTTSAALSLPLQTADTLDLALTASDALSMPLTTAGALDLALSASLQLPLQVLSS